MSYSAFAIARHALSGHRRWPLAWRTPQPKSDYEAIIVGGGGHGLATAYYLAKNHGMRRVAVLEKGWLGGGNTARNTTVIRSNYFYPESARLYEFSLRLYERLSRELNYNVMFSPRGFLVLAHSRHELELQRRSANAVLMNGVDAELLDRAEVEALIPIANFSPDARFPILGGMLQRRGGVARHDAVAWGYARAADRLGVDIIQNCPVEGFLREGDRVTGVVTPLGAIRAPRIGVAAAGASSAIVAKAGLRLPITSYALQAMVSEPVKPVLDTVVLSPPLGIYVSQTDKGELVVGGALDHYPSHAQRGNSPVLEASTRALVELFPSFSRLRLLRQWAGAVDIVKDSSPVIGRTPIGGLYVNCGWGTGGFKAIPAGGFVFAHTIANDEPHPIAAPFGLERFARGALVDEAAAAGIAH